MHIELQVYVVVNILEHRLFVMKHIFFWVCEELRISIYDMINVPLQSW